MLDTSVLIPALWKPKPTDDPACAPLFDALVQANRHVYIAAPACAELLRRAPKSSIPRKKNVIVVPFDRRAAEMLATLFPPEVLVQERTATGTPLNYIKYDAMIAACAARHRVEVFISADARQRALAEKAGLTVREPGFYLEKQAALFQLPPSDKRSIRSSRPPRSTPG
jgi:predicted nucleic acid-binding protein